MRIRVSLRPLALVFAVVLLGLAVSACSKCDIPTWGGPGSCRAGVPLQ